jgi:hypothetical protein
LHKGVELNAKYKILPTMEIGAFASIGDWTYTDDVAFDVYDDDRNYIGTYHAYIKDLKVADAPQTQFGIIGNWDITHKITIGANYNYNANLYSRFDPAKRTDETDREQSYKLPSYGLLNGMFKYKFKIGKLDSYFLTNVYNIMNKEYASEGWDNAVRDSNGDYAHGKENFKGFWGYKRKFNFALKIMY